MIVSTGLFIIASLSIMRSIGKELPITWKMPLFSILIQVIFLSVYTLASGISLLDPFLIVGLLVGLIVGLIKGGTTEIYWKQDRKVRKRSKIFLLFWLASILLNQILITLDFGYGIVLTIFTTGTLIGFEGKILQKIWRLESRPSSVKVPAQSQAESSVELEEQMMCSNCGDPIDQNHKFCSRCGQKIEY
jgi:hypothetical protein